MTFNLWLESNPFADRSHVFSADPVHGIGGVLGTNYRNDPNAATMIHGQPNSDVKLQQTAIHNPSIDMTVVQSIMNLLTKIDVRLSRLETKLI